MLILYYLVGYVQYIINMHGLACTERNFSLSKAGFPLDGILCAERNFSLSCDFSGGTN